MLENQKTTARQTRLQSGPRNPGAIEMAAGALFQIFPNGRRIAADAEDLKIAFLELAKKSTSMRGTNALATQIRDL